MTCARRSHSRQHYTLGSAYAEFAETRQGSITTGKPADRPVLTMVGGRIVFDTR